MAEKKRKLKVVGERPLSRRPRKRIERPRRVVFSVWRGEVTLWDALTNEALDLLLPVEVTVESEAVARQEKPWDSD